MKVTRQLLAGPKVYDDPHLQRPSVSLTLDLWSLGHSAGDIVRKLGYANRREVERIVETARKTGDERAVYHVTSGYIRGTEIPNRQRRQKRRQTHFRGFLLVDVLGAPLCSRGHMRTPHNVDRSGHCRQCERSRKR